MTKQQTKLVSVEMWVTAENLSHHEQKQVLAVRSSPDGSAKEGESLPIERRLFQTSVDEHRIVMAHILLITCIISARPYSKLCAGRLTAKLITPIASKTLGSIMVKTWSREPLSSGSTLGPLMTTETTMTSIDKTAGFTSVVSGFGHASFLNTAHPDSKPLPISQCPGKARVGTLRSRSLTQ
jgi:hypothetical protein